MSAILSLSEAAEFVCLDASRFLELVSKGWFPEPVGRDPAQPEWHREELLAVMQAREARRVHKMIAAGLLAETEPAPTCKRLETSEPVRSARAAGALHLLLESRGGRAYRRGVRDYRVYLPAGRRPDVLLHDLRILCPQHPFELIEAEPAPGIFE